MNSLSWLIYLAGVADGLGFFALMAFFFTAAWFVVLQIAGAVAGDEGHPDVASYRRKLSMRAIPFAVVALLLAAVIPTKGTVYAIAASEMGEKALNTQTGGKAVEALNAWLDRQIAGDEEKDGDKSE